MVNAKPYCALNISYKPLNERHSHMVQMCHCVGVYSLACTFVYPYVCPIKSQWDEGPRGRLNEQGHQSPATCRCQNLSQGGKGGEERDLIWGMWTICELKCGRGHWMLQIQKNHLYLSQILEKIKWNESFNSLMWVDFEEVMRLTPNISLINTCRRAQMWWKVAK